MSRAAHSHSRVPQAPGSQSLGRPEARASIVMVWPSAFAMTHLLPALGPSGPAAASGGYQHPWLGFPPKCSLTVVNSCAPSYAELAANDELWPCPAGRKPTPRPGENGSSSWPVGRCVPGAGAGGAAGCTAAQLNQSHPCCCAADGCWAQPRFNTVIGVCRGNSCACGGAGTTAPSCQPEGFPDSCGKTPWNAPDPASRSRNCTGSSVPCCHTADVSRLVPFYDIGSRAVLNYWAAYSWDPQAKLWRAQPQSSFNANGSRPPFDLMQRFGGLSEAEAWLAPQPGGSADWGLGYYPAGAPGVGGQPASGDDDSGGGGGGGGSRGGAAMFVLSTEEFFGATWYMLNQLELDRGPKVKMPVDRCETTNNNCWAAGNAGEMDFLEPGMSKGRADDVAVRSGYKASWSTQNNRMGRLFPGGVNTGGWASRNYLLTTPASDPQPVVYVAVVDSVGNWVYRVPADRANTIWPGIHRKTIAQTLQAAPSERPTQVNPCLGDYCLVFTSNCQARTRSEAEAQSCGFRPQDGFCGNWFAEMADTHQPLVPSQDCARDVRGGQTMPWCMEMVNTSSATSR